MILVTNHLMHTLPYKKTSGAPEGILGTPLS